MPTQKMTRGALLDSGLVKLVPNSVGKRESDIGRCPTKYNGKGPQTILAEHVTLASIYADAPMYWQKDVTPVCRMNPRQLDAELAKQAKRLAPHATSSYGEWEQVNFLEMEVIADGGAPAPVADDALAFYEVGVRSALNINPNVAHIAR